MINKLKICKLHNEIDITIPFNTSGIKILISENGMGKTTVLKILHAVLTRQFYKLDTTDFDKIVLTFNEDKVTIRQSDLHRSYMTDHLPHEFKMLGDALSESSCKILLDSARRLSLRDLKEMPLLKYSAKVMKTPRACLAERLKKSKFDLNEALSDADRKIANCFSSEVLYLPTFRGTEEDLRNLGLVNSDLLKLDELARSGMQNIQEKIDKRLAEVMKTYTRQKQKQKNISDFVKTCNKYLIDKEIIYDETQGQIKYVKTGGRELDSMEQMSSGEKRIVSLFARLYLDSDKPCLIIMDEPENSMSVEWQKMLLPDILETPKCDYLIAATHSPFIFSNNLNLYTVALDEYIRRSE